MDKNSNISDVLDELDACRISRGMSRQAVADACGVSEATISRVFNGTVEPSYSLVQSITAAVQYKPTDSVIVPEECTQESYIAYLKELLQRREAENDRRIRQLQAHYNMLRHQDRREKVAWMVTALVLIAVFVLLFLYDFSHLDRGWIQKEIDRYYQSTALQAVKAWWSSLWA